MRPHPFRVRWLVASLALLAACGERPVVEAPSDESPEAPAAEAPQADPAQARAEIDAVNRQFAEAIGRGDAQGAAQVYTEDARILPPEMAPAEGREAIAQFWAGAVERLAVSGVQRATGEVEVFGETAYEQGTYRFDTSQGPAQGKYLVIWRRTPEGWRWHREIWNPGPAA